MFRWPGLVQVRASAQSLRQLDKINQQVAAVSAEFRNEGIYLADSYPDPATLRLDKRRLSRRFYRPGTAKP
jgi:hypothetical protein